MQLIEYESLNEYEDLALQCLYSSIIIQTDPQALSIMKKSRPFFMSMWRSSDFESGFGGSAARLLRILRSSLLGIWGLGCFCL